MLMQQMQNSIKLIIETSAILGPFVYVATEKDHIKSYGTLVDASNFTLKLGHV